MVQGGDQRGQLLRVVALQLRRIARLHRPQVLAQLLQRAQQPLHLHGSGHQQPGGQGAQGDEQHGGKAPQGLGQQALIGSDGDAQGGGTLFGQVDVAANGQQALPLLVQRPHAMALGGVRIPLGLGWQGQHLVPQ